MGSNQQRGAVHPAGLSHLFLQRFLPGGGHLRRWRALTGASFQQVNPGWARTLFVLKVEQYILVEGEELLMPSAVLSRLLAQEAALGPLFTRDQRQEQRVPFVVTDALLHCVEVFGRKWSNRGGEVSPQAHGRQWMRSNFSTERRAVQPLRRARKSCPAEGSASAGELIAKGSDSDTRYHKPMLTKERTP